MKFARVVLIVTVLLLIYSMVQANVSTPNVTVTPAYTNQNARYSISSNTGSQGNTNLEANKDTIIIVFNDSTTIPASITPSLITVNNTPVNYLSISGRRLAILTPTPVANKGGPFTVVVDSAANIQNPFVAGDYRLRVATSKPSDVTLVYSNLYTITQSATLVSPAAVTPNPSIASASASYSIGFDLGAGGYIQAGVSTITIEFPSGTYIPTGGLSGVTVNGTGATANALNDSVVITTPVTIQNEGSVQIIFGSGSGLKNPVSDGTYNLRVKTSSEPTFVTSDDYTISPAGQLSISAITAKPEKVNESGEFAFEFFTGSFGDLTSQSDSISVIFAPNTYIPSDLSASNVIISSGGFTNSAYAVAVAKFDASDDDTVHIVTPIDISASSSVTVTFNASAGYLNPSVAGNYEIGLYTSTEPTVVQSNPFSVFNTTTTISQPVVTPGSSSTSAYTFYSIDFNLGTLGRLKPGESTITLQFESGYTLDTDNTNYDSTYISVGGGSYTLIDTSYIFPNNTAKTVQITIPESVITQNGSSISLIVGGTGTQPIQNPGTAGIQYLGVKTSVEATNVNSLPYAIGGTAITVDVLALTDSTVNSPSQYSFDITLTTTLVGNENDEIKIIFPEGTYVPNGSLGGSVVQIDGQGAKSVIGEQSTRTLTATLANGRTASGATTVVVTTSAGIINPTVPSSSYYKVILYTNEDTSPVSSRIYSIIGDATQVTVDTVSANPSVINAAKAAYSFTISTSATGKIVGGSAAGSSTITIDFDSTIVPATISPSTVEVNSIPSQAVEVLSSGLDGMVKITLPLGLTINNSSAFTVDFDTSAGLTNGATAGVSNVKVRTSSDTTYGTGNLNLSASQSLSVTSVTTNPTAQNATAGYSIVFKTGSGGALQSGDDIWIIFPAGTVLPASMSASDLKVNNVNPSVAPVISDDTLFITIPNAIGNLANVTVLINQTAGILNPPLVQSYTLEIGTDAETGPYTSPSYSITQTTTTVTSASVTVTTPTPGATSDYTIAFSTGANGKLVAGTSTITIKFNASTGVNQDSTIYTNTSIVADGQSTAIPVIDISITGREVTLIVPTGVNIGNNESVSVILDGGTKPITNPGTSGEYTLEVKTSVEITYITSNSYTITSASAVTGLTVAVNPTTVNANGIYTINFQVQNTVDAGTGTITVTYPFNTYVPSTISTAMVTVATGNPNPGTPQSADAIVTNPSTRTVTINVQQELTANDSVEVIFAAGAGIINPSIAGSYNLQVKTSSQPLNATSASYTITTTTSTITGLQVLANPTTPSTVAQYTFNFTTGAFGRLVSGTSTITLLIPHDADFTLGAPAPSKVTVNANASDAVVLTQGGTNPDTLTITIPSNVTIGNNTGVTVVINSTAGLQNASFVTPLWYQAYTSVETGIDSIDYSLPVELSSFSVSSINGQAILKWVTESEVQNAYWIVERKSVTNEEYKSIQDGKMGIQQTAAVFSENARLEGMGNSAARQEYVYIDSLVEVNSVYAYRLIDVSYSGVKTYHNVTLIEVKAPQSYELLQNYPNPFNPITTIEYRIPVAANVELKIYNILGQEVITLVNMNQKAGFYKEQWNGRDIRNNLVASGIYLYYIRAKSLDGKSRFDKVNKMVLIK